jgi:hypothetical protein
VWGEAPAPFGKVSRPPGPPRPPKSMISGRAQNPEKGTNVAEQRQDLFWTRHPGNHPGGGSFPSDRSHKRTTSPWLDPGKTPFKPYETLLKLYLNLIKTILKLY